MNIWVLKHGEQLPLTLQSRIYRMGMIALKCADKKDKVTWWTSDFNHAMKIKENTENIANPSITFKFLNGTSYKKNISIKRLINHYQIGTKLDKEMSVMNNKPDVILSSMPTIDFAYRAVKYGKEHGIPVIIDVRDLWPDVFMDLIPINFLKKPFIFKSFNRKLKWLLENSAAITSITDNYLFWALDKANLEFDQDKHMVFPIGYPDIIKDYEKSPLDNSYFNIIFIGTIGVHFDLETVLKVAELTKNENIRYYIIGDGDKKKELETKFPLQNVIFTGWLDGESLNRYLSNGNVGIAPYKNTKNFLMNVPNKFYEYMAHGLPTITCLPGPAEDLVMENNLGLMYKEGNKEELYKSIIKLKDDEGFYNEASSNAIATFREKYSTSVIYEDYYKLIRNTVEKSKK